MPAPARPINRIFSPIVALDVELPISRADLEELGVRGLQSGCGDAVRRHWLNSDYRSLHDEHDQRTAPGRVYRVAEDRFFLQHEVPEPFPIEDGSLAWCYSEHFIEHLTPADGIAWLADMHRLLEPGGFVRVSTPDLRRYARSYLDPSDPFLREHGLRIADLIPDASGVERPAFMVNHTFYSWGHKWLYDFDEMCHAAVAAGFSADAVEQRGFRDSRAADVATVDVPSRADESFYVEIEKR